MTETTLSLDQRRKIGEIRAALGKSDHAVRTHFAALDAVERAAKKGKTARVTRRWTGTLNELHGELLQARGRLDALHTGLRAQGQLRRSVVLTAEAVAHWRDGLRAGNPKRVAHAKAQMRAAFAAAQVAGRHGEYLIERGQ